MARWGSMFKDLDKTKLAARAVTGFLAGALGTYINRVLGSRSLKSGRCSTLKRSPAHDAPVARLAHMAKASLIFGLVYGIFCMCVPHHLVLATVLFMGVLGLRAGPMSSTDCSSRVSTTTRCGFHACSGKGGAYSIGLLAVARACRETICRCLRSPAGPFGRSEL